MDEIQINRIDTITGQIIACKQSMGRSILEIGKLLIEAKDALPHGDWGNWLRERVEFSERTAQNFMRVAREYASNPQLVADLGSVRKAIALLGKRQKVVAGYLADTDVLIKAAAVADYKPARVAGDKMKKKDMGEDLSIPLDRTADILGWVAEHRHPGLYVCGFSMETRDMVENSRSKLDRKHLDLIVANNLKVEGAGFGVTTNVVTLISDDHVAELPMMGKDDVAAQLLDVIEDRRPRVWKK